MPTKEGVARAAQPRPNVAGAIRIKNDTPVDDVKIYTPSVKARKNFETRVFSAISPERVDQIKAAANDWLAAH